ncbi:amidohydrolase family protein [Nonomuraea sp. NPDC048826]|uniref:amidohydrolase family protein n=1 Tax=Nonomuraea sp. NPDC048826 TaxID=3364347 RepID=UPI0037191045
MPRLTPPAPRSELLLRPKEVFGPDGVLSGVVVLVLPDGTIGHVGPEAGLPPAGDDRVTVDAPGSVLLPGLIDLHYLLLHAHSLHHRVSPTAGVLEAADTLERLVRAGVTGLRDTSSDGTVMLDLRQLVRDGSLAGPDLFVSGSPIGAGGRGGAVYGSTEVDGPYEARKCARRAIRTRIDFLSVAVTNGVAGGGIAGPGWLELRDDEIEAAVAEARAAGRPVSANAIGVDGISAAIRAGVDTIEHATMLTPEQADLMAERGIAMVPTLTIMHTFAERPDEVGLPPHLLDRVRRLLDAGYAAVEHALRAGVTIGAGTDSHGHETVVDEIGHLADAGLSVSQAVGAATAVAGGLLGPDARRGRLEPGQVADLLLVRGPVDALPRTLRTPELVIRNGRPVRAGDAVLKESLIP